MMQHKLSENTLIYDWNRRERFKFRHKRNLQLDDETLRDGLQSPSVTDPSIEEKIRLLELMEDLKIDTADIGLPGAGPRARADITTMVKHMVDNKMNITPNCAVRTVKQDITPLIEISQKVGCPIEACTFMYVTEDTTRADPKTIRKLYTTAINAGARRICVCDTVGHATPVGVSFLMKYVRDIVDKTKRRVKIDWHGHSDRGLAIPNTMAAVAHGADRVHATGLGIGERVGNTPMDLLLVNLSLEGIYKRDLSKLADYCRLISEACEVAIPKNYPVMGRDAFRTGTGVHAAAIIKAQNKGDDWLADRVYSGVPAAMVGLKQIIEIGFMSGVSNIVYWLKVRGIEPDKKLVDEIFRAAKQHNRILTDEELEELVKFRSQEPEETPLETLGDWDKEIKPKRKSKKRKK
jgi:2-isopropylmalate synthase